MQNASILEQKHLSSVIWMPSNTNKLKIPGYGHGFSENRHECHTMLRLMALLKEVKLHVHYYNVYALS